MLRDSTGSSSPPVTPLHLASVRAQRQKGLKEEKQECSASGVSRMGRVKAERCWGFHAFMLEISGWVPDGAADSGGGAQCSAFVPLLSTLAPCSCVPTDYFCRASDATSLYLSSRSAFAVHLISPDHPMPALQVGVLVPGHDSQAAVLDLHTSQ